MNYSHCNRIIWFRYELLLGILFLQYLAYNLLSLILKKTNLKQNRVCISEVFVWGDFVRGDFVRAPSFLPWYSLLTHKQIFISFPPCPKNIFTARKVSQITNSIPNILVDKSFFWSTRPTHSHGRKGSVFSHMLSVRPSIRPSPLFKFRKTKQQKTMFAIGVTMGLAEWIIDDTWLVFILSVRTSKCK